MESNVEKIIQRLIWSEGHNRRSALEVVKDFVDVDALKRHVEKEHSGIITPEEELEDALLELKREYPQFEWDGDVKSYGSSVRIQIDGSSGIFNGWAQKKKGGRARWSAGVSINCSSLKFPKSRTRSQRWGLIDSFSTAYRQMLKENSEALAEAGLVVESLNENMG